jgi:hypothetical protein
MSEQGDEISFTVDSGEDECVTYDMSRYKSSNFLIDMTHNVVYKETAAAAAYESVRARARARESVSE